MKVYFAKTAGHKIQSAVLDRRGVRRRLISYVDTAAYKKVEAARRKSAKPPGRDVQSAR